MSRTTASFYWYDLETSGTEPRWDRITQIAGMRTDLDLNPLGDEFCTYVRLPDDVLPSPAASLVTGIMPELTAAEGITEWQALTRLEAIFRQPQTCVAGYNSLRFDDEFTRFGFYRNLLDPYAREWQQGNSRWDIIDLVRATGALRREGIRWPTNDEGHPAYNLELMTKANELEHGNAHDAMSDVVATVALARLIRTAQPRLFSYYFDMRGKKRSRELLEPFGERMCLHVSGMYPRQRYCCAPVISLCRHPSNANSIVVADLSQDIDSLLTWPAEEIAAKLFEPGAQQRPPLKEVRVNRAPFLAGIEVLTEENWSRLGFDRRALKERARRLRAPGIAQKIIGVYRNREPGKAVDADAALYDAFLKDRDRDRAVSLQQSLARDEWVDLDYEDARLKTLAARLKARSFTQHLGDEERADWHEFVTGKLHAADVPWRTLESFRAELATQRESLGDEADARSSRILEALSAHAQRLEDEYPA